MRFKPSQKNEQDFNGGTKYKNGDGLHADTVNNVIESLLWSQSIATNQPNIENINGDGTPSVSIEEFDGTPRFKFQNLKGEKGIDGKDHSEEIAQLNEKLETYFISAKEQIDINSEEISENSAKIHNLTGALLEGGVMGVVEVEQAYSVRQTADGEDIVDYNGEGQFTFPEKITGATVKTTNLIPYPYSQVSINNPFNSDGITFTENSDGSISVVGTATATSYCRIGEVYLMSGEKYTLSAGAGSANAFVYVQRPISNETYSAISGTITFTAKNTGSYEVYITVRNGITVNMTIYPMLNEGDAAEPFIPYFAGLKNSYFKGIVSVKDGNYLNENALLNNEAFTKTIYNNQECIKFEPTHNGSYNLNNICFVPAGKYINFSFDIAAPNGSHIYVFFRYNDGTIAINETFYVNSSSSSWVTRKIISALYAKKPITTMQLDVYDTATKKPFYLRNMQVSVSDTASGATYKDYEPYKADESFMLDEAVKLCRWDSINPASGKITRATKTIVFDDTKNWVESSREYNTYKFTISEYAASDTCVYSNAPFKVRASGGSVTIGYSILEIYDCTFTSADDLNAYLAGKPLTVAYELATPTTETVEFPTKKYQAWNGGSETLVQGDTDNSTFGAMPTVGQEYFVKVGGVTDEQTE